MYFPSSIFPQESDNVMSVLRPQKIKWEYGNIETCNVFSW